MRKSKPSFIFLWQLVRVANRSSTLVSYLRPGASLGAQVVLNSWEGQ
jgi:hypothetical protein